MEKKLTVLLLVRVVGVSFRYFWRRLNSGSELMMKGIDVANRFLDYFNLKTRKLGRLCYTKFSVQWSSLLSNFWLIF